MIRRRTLRTRGIKMLVLDEADEMLNKGFKEQIYDVYRFVGSHSSRLYVTEWTGQLPLARLNCCPPFVLREMIYFWLELEVAVIEKKFKSS